MVKPSIIMMLQIVHRNKKFKKSKYSVDLGEEREPISSNKRIEEKINVYTNPGSRKPGAKDVQLSRFGAVAVSARDSKSGLHLCL